MSDSHFRWVAGISCFQLEGLSATVMPEDTMPVGTLVDAVAGESNGGGHDRSGTPSCLSASQ